MDTSLQPANPIAIELFDVLGRVATWAKARVRSVVTTAWIMVQGFRILTGQSREPMMGLVVSASRTTLILIAASTMALGGSSIQTFFTDTMASGINGLATVRKQNVTRGRETSRSESEERRALMLPQELKAMGADTEVFLCEGIPHPVKCDKIRYYQDSYFTRRLKEKVPIPVLSI